jgi:hypothetical protein
VARQFILYFAIAATAWGQTDPQALVRQSVANYQRDWRASRNWAWTQTDVAFSEGEKEVTVSEMAPLEGTPWERVITKDGHPLTPEEQRREDRKFEKAMKQRESESPAERADRIRKYENERAFINDIPEAYHFTLLGQEDIEGRPAWLLQMTPQPGFIPNTPHASMLKHIEGKLWIDKEDLQWVKADAQAKDSVGFGWFIARVERGARFTLDQTRVANGLWMPSRLTVKGLVRVMMLFGRGLNEDVIYSGYHLAKEVQANQ